MQDITSEYLRVEQAAQFINMSVPFLRREGRLGTGPERIRCGKVWLFPITGLRRWMAEHVEQRTASV